MIKMHPVPIFKAILRYRQDPGDAGHAVSVCAFITLSGLCRIYGRVFFWGLREDTMTGKQIISAGVRGQILQQSDGVFIFPGFCDVHVHFREPGFSYK